MHADPIKLHKCILTYLRRQQVNKSHMHSLLPDCQFAIKVQGNLRILDLYIESRSTVSNLILDLDLGLEYLNGSYRLSFTGC